MTLKIDYNIPRFVRELKMQNAAVTQKLKMSLTFCSPKEALLPLFDVQYTFLFKLLRGLGSQGHQLLLVESHFACF